MLEDGSLYLLRIVYTSDMEWLHWSLGRQYISRKRTRGWNVYCLLNCTGSLETGGLGHSEFEDGILITVSGGWKIICLVQVFVLLLFIDEYPNRSRM